MRTVQSRSASPRQLPRPNKRTRVFVVHGRNDAARQAMFTFLRSIGLQPIEWEEAVSLTGGGTPFIGKVLDKAFSAAQAVVVLMTGDDVARLHRSFVRAEDESYDIDLTPQPRPNVLFEAGMAFGRHPEHTILVALGKLRPFSDISGRHVVHINNSPESRQRLADRLRRAGCLVRTAGRTDWHQAGDFDGAAAVPEDAGQEGG